MRRSRYFRNKCTFYSRFLCQGFNPIFIFKHNDMLLWGRQAWGLIFCLGFLLRCSTPAARLELPPHTPDWGVYYALLDEQPTVFSIDLALREQAPVLSHPQLVLITLENNATDPSGSVLPLLNSWQDSLTKSLQQQAQVLSVGWTTAGGKRRLIFYGPQRSDYPELVKTISRGNAIVTNVEIVNDNNWEYYRRTLYPSEQEMNQIQNGRMLSSLSQAGDDLSQARPFDHWFYFTTSEDRTRFLSAIADQGFSVIDRESVLPEGEQRYELHLLRNDKPDELYLNEFTWKLAELARQYNGLYDGWETQVVKK